MPGFFETLGRLFKGEPVFKPGEQEDGSWKEDHTVTTPAEPQSPVTEQRSNRTDGKIAPVVIVENVDCNISNENMDLFVTIKNKHNQPVFLDKILLLGTKWELDRTFLPGEERQMQAYHGQRPQNTSQTKVELHYRDESGDYFSAIHSVEFEQQRDKTYTVRRIRFIPPIKDI